MMSIRDGEVLDSNDIRIVVRGHFTAEEMQRLTGKVGFAKRTWWRHAYTPLRQRQLIPVRRSRFVEARKPGRGAFAVTVLVIRRES